MLEIALMISLALSTGVSVIMNIWSYIETKKLSVGYTIFGVWSIIAALVLIF